jgi:hypothetical protein
MKQVLFKFEINVPGRDSTLIPSVSGRIAGFSPTMPGLRGPFLHTAMTTLG